MNLAAYRKRLDRLSLQYQVAVESNRRDRKARSAAIAHHKTMVTAQKILQEIAQKLQEQAHRNIATIVSECLTAVFDDPYQFQIRFEQKRGKTEAHLEFKRKGHRVNPLKAAGGGVVDVASFALRLSCILLSKPRLSKLLVLDEPFKMLSSNSIDRVREMLERLASELGMQFIIVTHIRELRGSTAWHLTTEGKLEQWQ